MNPFVAIRLMTTTLAGSDRVTLNGGLTVSVDALRVLWDLEDRGFALWLDGHTLCIRPAAALTATDRQALTVHRDELQALVTSCATTLPS